MRKNIQVGGERDMDTENLIRLIQAVSDSALTGFRYEEGGVRVHLTKK